MISALTATFGMDELCLRRARPSEQLEIAHAHTHRFHMRKHLARVLGFFAADMHFAS